MSGRSSSLGSRTRHSSARSCCAGALPASTSTRSIAGRRPAPSCRRSARPSHGRYLRRPQKPPPGRPSRQRSMPEFDFNGHRISYEEHGAGERPLVLIHGLLMNRRMLDHLEIDQAVIGGTSLGANATLETAYLAPDRVKGMMVEMPVLDNALLAAAVIFTPIMIVLRFGEPALKVVASLARRVPRTNFLLDIGLDWLRQDPAPSSAVLEGLFLGSAAPHHDFRVQMTQPTLVIGHHADPLHPFSDSGMLCEELPNAHLVEANSILEWRIAPDRLDDELAAFLDEVWEGQAA